MVARIGVVADTHVGEWVAELPDSVLHALSGVDVILHAGDITDLSVLERLAAVAPVVAVQGDHDRAAGIVLPRARVVEIAGYRIGLTHGRRARPVELAGAIASMVLGRAVLIGFRRALRRRFRDVDAIVFGHLHLPVTCWDHGILYFSPGALHNAERAPGFAAGGVGARAYLRFRRSLAPEQASPAIGIIDADRNGLVARIVPVALEERAEVVAPR